MDISQHVKLQGGQAHVGYVGSGLIFSMGPPVSTSTSASAFNSENIALGRGIFASMATDCK